MPYAQEHANLLEHDIAGHHRNFSMKLYWKTGAGWLAKTTAVTSLLLASMIFLLLGWIYPSIAILFSIQIIRWQRKKLN